ncbi:MAG TPA: hypothetical protein PLN06_04095 [Bacteroidales bacterium]|nr:hypothetical protein [Bacteroidales bacterium]HOU95788.1 hypothetical protein [Bacteroidales bacterium]HQG36573.1 hypothetical protein [Bacteroidales bacterium]HQG52922.1 hypothetical protein [Bacteroidales bacterium]HQJ21035.1 hypothetical protein [Bacteroidales bacterium]
MRRLLSIFSLLTLIAFVAIAQPYSFPTLKGYKIKSNYPVYTPETLWDFIDGAADGYIAYGFENVHIREYKKGRNIIKLEIYKHKDINNAFGIYASERSPSFRFINVGAQGYKTNDGSLNFFKDRYYVKIRTYSKNEKVLNDLESLAIKVADMLPGDSSLPKTLREFPESNKVNNTETFINKEVLGHEFLSEAFKAQYEINGTAFSIYLIEKDIPDEIQEMAKKYLSKAELEPENLYEGKYIFRDGYNGDIFLAWKNTRMLIIQGLAKDQSAIADRYTSEILD